MVFLDGIDLSVLDFLDAALNEIITVRQGAPEACERDIDHLIPHQEAATIIDVHSQSPPHFILVILIYSSNSTCGSILV